GVVAVFDGLLAAGVLFLIGAATGPIVIAVAIVGSIIVAIIVAIVAAIGVVVREAVAVRVVWHGFPANTGQQPEGGHPKPFERSDAGGHVEHPLVTEIEVCAETGFEGDFFAVGLREPDGELGFTDELEPASAVATAPGEREGGQELRGGL